MKTQTMGTQGPVGSPVAEVRRPPQPVEKLKAERVQEKLKAERVQELLKAMPGWKLGKGGRSIYRRREFDTAAAAASFAGFVAGLSAAADQAVSVYLSGGTVEVSLPGRSWGGPSAGLSLEVLGFAQQIG